MLMLIFIMILLLLGFIKFNNKFLLSNSLFILMYNYMFMNNFFNEWIYIYMNLGLNFYSYGLMLMILWIMGLVILSINKILNLNLCLLILFVMTIILILNFISLNILYFYFFFEVSLLLIFMLIMKWGLGYLRVMASFYLMFYTLFFSMPLMMIFLYIQNFLGTDLFMIMEKLNFNLNMLMFLYLISSFLIKLPMFFFHGWLLKAHVEAPVFGSMILAAIMLKLGSYGLLRFMMIFIQNFLKLNCYFIEFGLIGSIILSILCFRQIDMKILVAMSSVVHMNLMMSSMFTLTKLSFLGGYLMMIAHGLCSSGLFYILNLCYMETHSRLMLMNKGIMIMMTSMSLLWFMLCSSNMAAPFSLNLVSEIFLLMSLISWLKLLIIKLVLYCLLSFMYSLYFFSYLNHGKVNLFMKMSSGKLINFFILLMHWIPLNLIVFNLNFLI